MLYNIFQRLWSLLPDRCGSPGCSRLGVRGNEHVVDGMVMCDDCRDRYLVQKRLHTENLRSRISGGRDEDPS